jgi:hypothetical protein
VSRIEEPARLLDPDADTPAPLRDALDAGRAELPDAARLARLAARLPLGGPPSPPSPPAPPPAAPLAPAAAPSVLSGALVGAALALAVVGGAFVREALTENVGAQTIATTTARPAVSAPPVEASRAAVEPPATRLDPPPPSASPAASTPPPRASAPPTASASAPSPAPTIEASAAPEPPAAGESEVALLQRAQDALGADPARALALASEHEQRFPRGSLGQERELLAVSALVALGRSEDARARAIRFLARHPDSAHRSRLLAIVPGLDRGDPHAPGPAGLADALQKNEPPR